MACHHRLDIGGVLLAIMTDPGLKGSGRRLGIPSGETVAGFPGCQLDLIKFPWGQEPPLHKEPGE